jgi:hypothetical protein
MSAKSKEPKILSPDEIECLLGVRSTDAHPLDILGYGYTLEGAHLFRAEQPNFLPQIAAHVHGILRRTGIFPEGTNRDEPDYKTYIYTDGASFRVSSMEEIGFSRLERFSTAPLTEEEAIHKYVRQVANPDYIH